MTRAHSLVPSEASTERGQPYVALVLQGGGALGAYHLGAFKALVEKNIQPHWICGISIGAINAAIIAGNKTQDRMAQLDKLWDYISYPDYLSFNRYEKFSKNVQRYINTLSMTQTTVLGQPNFFRPRFPSPTMIRPVDVTQASYYDSSPILKTLKKFADFSLINNSETRLSLGATNIRTGALEFFNNWETQITAKHVLASGSLPPAFGAMQIGEQYYWDGGCSSKTFLDAIVENMPNNRLLVFMVDLWSSENPHLPETMDDVSWRQTEIQCASRTHFSIQHHIQNFNLVQSFKEVGAEIRIPVEMNHYLFYKNLDIVHITYQPMPDQVSNRAAEFSRSSIEERRLSGYQDMRVALEKSPWKAEARDKSTSTSKARYHRIILGEQSIQVSSDVA